MKHLVFILLITLTLFSCTSGEETALAKGSIESAEVIVSAEGNGRILSFTGEEGTEVSEGDVLGTIDDRQLILQREQLLAAQKRITSQIPDITTQTAPLEQQLAAAREDQRKITLLTEVNAAPQKQQDDIDAQVLTLEKQLSAQKQTLEKSVESLTYELASLTSQIAQLDDRIEKCVITSPVSGTLLTTYIEAGEMTASGKPLFKVADLTRVFLRAYITASQLSQLKLGDTVTVRIDDGTSDSRFYEGTISWISQKAEFTPKTVQTRDERAAQVYAIKIALINDGYLKLGMYGALTGVN